MNKHPISIKRIIEIIRLIIIEILAIINWYSKIAVSNVVYLLTSILLTLRSTLTHFWLYRNSMVISSVLDCERVWTIEVIKRCERWRWTFWTIARGCAGRLWHIHQCHQIYGVKKWRTLKDGLLLAEEYVNVGLFGLLRRRYRAR